MLDGLDLAWEDQPERGRRGQPGTRQQQRRRRSQKRGGRSFGALIISVVLLVALGGGVYYGVGWVQDKFGTADYTHTSTTEVQFVVHSGDGYIAIGQQLEQQGIVKSSKAFIAAADADKEKAGQIQPGTYKLFSQMPGATAFAYLIDPGKHMITNKVTIPEGLSTFEIYKLLAQKTGIPEKDFTAAAKEAVKKIPDTWFARGDKIQPIKGVEGFLFPDTYSFGPDMKAQQILETMIDRFMTVAGEIKLADGGQGSPKLSPFQAVIIASLIQKEAYHDEDMGKISRVFYNRLFTNFPGHLLGSEVTINYWLLANGRPVVGSDKQQASDTQDASNPYNTYVHPGIPPGPISSPGKAALLAAINPTAGPWTYFIATDKAGTTEFATSQAQFDVLWAKAHKNGVV